MIYMNQSHANEIFYLEHTQMDIEILKRLVPT